MRLAYLLLFLFFSILEAKEVFTKEHINRYLTIENPFIYSAVGNVYVYKQKENYQLGNFDTKITAKYDKKDYPTTDGEYLSAGISKPLENGMELSLDYRDAEGTQEYNNIKTGDDGEILVGVKIPVFELAHNINKRKLDLYSARLDTKKMTYEAKNKLRILYFKIISSYYQLLYHRQSKELISHLLENAKKRITIIQKRVDVGSLATLSLLEAKQQIINRKQRLLSAQNKYNNSLNNFLKYLNINIENFEQDYTLPLISKLQNNTQTKDESYSIAIENRPDLKIYVNEIKKLSLENKYTAVKSYPNFDLGLYGAHDFKYDNGFKVTIGMDFPIERRKYQSKTLEIKKSIKNLNKQKEKTLIIIKTEIELIHNSMDTLMQNIQNSQTEVELVVKLEEAEKKKYKVGLSNLFMLNQREIYTLQIKKKLLKYYFDYYSMQQKLDKIIGKSFDVIDNKNI